MVDLLGFVGRKLEEAGIPYEFGEWTQAVSYPYFVGDFTESDYRYEDNRTAGTFTLDGWSRGSKLALIEASDKIKEIFRDFQEVSGNSLFHVRFGGALPVPTGEDELFKITITLFTCEWKGE